MNLTVASPPFSQTLADHGLHLTRKAPSVLQINVGKLCNLTCVHCHVDAGPHRTEIASRETLGKMVAWLDNTSIRTVDLTGGTPEMIPDFRYFVQAIRAMDLRRHMIIRCNLSILLEPGYEWVPDCYVENELEVVASMPCYSPENVNAQRGERVFERSIEALQLLNRLGYGKGDERLPLHLVYNPNGAFIPGDQAELEADYKRELEEHFGITFDRLYALANLPIARFASYLKREGEYESYLQTLIEAFNPASVERLMCRDTLSVSWLGDVYDCDFNQMLDMTWKRENGGSIKVWDLDPRDLDRFPIQTGMHCYGCTAGAGSSCGGALT